MQPPSITPTLRLFVSQLKQIPISVNNEHCYVLYTHLQRTLLFPCIMCYVLNRHLQYRFTKTVNLYESHTTRIKDHFRVTCTCKYRRLKFSNLVTLRTERHVTAIRSRLSISIQLQLAIRIIFHYG